jgi:teichuronic acid biosynthesis glycosyltransferase TuaC
MSEPRRILTFTSLFPSSARPRHGIFVRTRLLQTMRRHALDVRVIAPVPWFPFRARLFGEYARFAATPRRATLDNGVQVVYSRYPMMPHVGVAHQPDAMARAALAVLARWRAEGWSPELVDAHYLYPDGVAAALVAERIGVPFVMTARGTDVNVLARMAGPGRRIAWAAQKAAAVVAVSSRLKQALVELGMRNDVVVLRNGVDPELFQPADRAAARAELGWPDGTVLACVGNLVPEKGFTLAIEALAQLPGATLVVVGDGPHRAELEATAARLDVGGRVRFIPVMAQGALPRVYSAADALLLTSTREGWPNVVLEALACGTPVVGVDVGAVAEMLSNPAVGRVVAQRDPALLAEAVRSLLQSPPPRPLLRQHAERFDWASIARGQMDLFEHILGGTQPLQRAAAAESGVSAMIG